MPKGIYKRSDSFRQNQSIRMTDKKGPLAIHFGKKHSTESREKMSKSHNGHMVSRKTKKKISLGLTGFKRPPRTKEHKEKHRLTLLGIKHPNRKKPHSFTDKHRKNLSKALIGRICTPQTREKIGMANKGENNGMYLRRKNKNPNWKGGITPINIKIRTSPAYREWQNNCLKRDNFTDQKTGIRGGKLVVHHIYNFSSHSELRFDVKNGITLSEKSHKEFHKKYGIRNNTREQLEKFLGKIS